MGVSPDKIPDTPKQVQGAQAAKQVEAAKLQKEIQQAKHIEKLMQDSGVTRGELGKLAELMGFGKGDAALSKLFNYIYDNYPKLRETGAKSPQEQQEICKRLVKAHVMFFSNPKFASAAKKWLETKGESGQKIPRFILIFTPGQGGTSQGAGRLYGIAIITKGGRTIEFTSRKLQKFLSFLKGDGKLRDGVKLSDLSQDEQELYKMMGEEGMQGLLESLKGCADDPSIGFQPPDTLNSNDDNSSKTIGFDYLDAMYGQNDIYNDCMRIIKDGLAQMTQTMSDYVQYEIKETERMMEETTKKLEEAKKQEKKDEVAKLEDKMGKLIEKKKKLEIIKEKIEAFIKMQGELASLDEGTMMTFKGQLDAIKAELQEFVKWSQQGNNVLSKEELSEFNKAIDQIDKKSESLNLSLNGLKKAKGLSSQKTE